MSKETVSSFSEAKAFIHIDRVQSILSGKLPPPVTVEVDLTDGFCNQSCPHCFFSTPTKSNPVFFPLERALSLAAELRSIGVRAIEFPGGGEPTTHPDFEKIIEAFASVQLPLGLVTNGLLSRKILPVIHLFQWVRVSLDAGIKEHYQLTHGSDNFDAIINGICRIVATKNFTRVGIGYLVTPSNWQSAESAVEIARSIGVDYIQFRPASKVSWHTNDERKIARKNIEQIKENNLDLDIYTSQHKWLRIEQGRSFPACQTSSLVGIVKADGTVPFCCLRRDYPDLAFGNILQQSFEEIWFGSKHRDSFLNVSHQNCPCPCKHDSYNEVFYALKQGIVTENFL